MNIERAEAKPVLAQIGSCALIERADFLSNGIAFQNAKIFLQAECDAARQTLQIADIGQIDQRLQLVRNQILQPGLQPAKNLLAIGLVQMLIDQQRDVGR